MRALSGAEGLRTTTSEAIWPSRITPLLPGHVVAQSAEIFSKKYLSYSVRRSDLPADSLRSLWLNLPLVTAGGIIFLRAAWQPPKNFTPPGHCIAHRHHPFAVIAVNERPGKGQHGQHGHGKERLHGAQGQHTARLLKQPNRQCKLRHHGGHHRNELAESNEVHPPHARQLREGKRRWRGVRKRALL